MRILRVSCRQPLPPIFCWWNSKFSGEDLLLNYSRRFPKFHNFWPAHLAYESKLILPRIHDRAVFFLLLNFNFRNFHNLHSIKKLDRRRKVLYLFLFKLVGLNIFFEISLGFHKFTRREEEEERKRDGGSGWMDGWVNVCVNEGRRDYWMQICLLWFDSK